MIEDSVISTERKHAKDSEADETWDEEEQESGSKWSMRKVHVHLYQFLGYCWFQNVPTHLEGKENLPYGMMNKI